MRAAALDGFQLPMQDFGCLASSRATHAACPCSPSLRASAGQSLHPANHAALPCSAQHCAREMDGLEAFLTYAMHPPLLT